MTEKEEPCLVREREEDGTMPWLADLAEAAAELLQQAIKKKDPSRLDFKDVKQLTGALKDLAELMELADEGSGEAVNESGGEREYVIRIEGDPSL